MAPGPPTTGDAVARAGGAAVLSPEARLLLATAPMEVDPDRIRELVSLDPDWSVVHGLAVRERAVIPLWRRLSPFSGAMPEEEAEAFGRLARVQEFRQRQLRERLLETLAVLDREEIEVVLLKGAALAHTLYPDFTERPMLDLDLLVAEERAEEARDVLLSSGWCEDRYFVEGAYRGHFHLAPLEDERGTGAVLEIHTGLFIPGHPFSLDAGRARSGAVPVDVGGRPAFVLPRVLQLLHTALHFAWSHMMASGGWRTFRDLQILADSARFSWDEFVALAHESGGASSCYWTLRLASRLGGIAVPREALDRLRPPLPDAVLDRLERHYALTLFPSEPGCPSVRLRRVLWRVGTLPGRDAGGSAAAGHRIVPWSRAEEFVPAEGTPVPRESWFEKILRHLQGERWGAYLLGVLRPSSSALGEGGPT